MKTMPSFTTHSKSILAQCDRAGDQICKEWN